MQIQVGDKIAVWNFFLITLINLSPDIERADK